MIGRARRLSGVVAAAFGLGSASLALASSGGLDPTFAGGQPAYLDPPAPYEALHPNALAVLPDGRVVAAGEGFRLSQQPDSAFVLTRLLMTGALDPGFGVKGKVVTDFGGRVGPNDVPGISNPANEDEARALLVQPDGKLLAAGSSLRGRSQTFALARYNPDGSLDAGFGAHGLVTTPFTSPVRGNALALQPDGAILLVGTLHNFAGTGMAVARYLPNGSLDPTFGEAGQLVLGFEANHTTGEAVALQADGRILLGGESEDWTREFTLSSTPTPGGGTSQTLAVPSTFRVARLNSDGSPDTTFGLDGSGSVLSDFGYQAGAAALLVQPDGRIVAAGYALPRTPSPDRPVSQVPPRSLAIARFNPDGGTDPSFGAGGQVVADGGSAVAIVLQADGRLVLAAGDSPPAVGRLEADGRRDASLGGGLLPLPGFESNRGHMKSVAVAPDGKLVALGWSGNIVQASGVVLRLQNTIAAPAHWAAPPPPAPAATTPPAPTAPPDAAPPDDSAGMADSASDAPPAANDAATSDESPSPAADPGP